MGSEKQAAMGVHAATVALIVVPCGTRASNEGDMYRADAKAYVA